MTGRQYTLLEGPGMSSAITQGVFGEEVLSSLQLFQWK